MTSVGILGSSGYTAVELIKILLRHQHVQIAALTTRQQPGPISAIHPALAGRCDLDTENLTATEIGKRCDFVFCCLPHVASMEAVPDLLAAGTRIIDLSADYRLNDADVYAKWYGHEHTDKQRLGSTPYGLPELFRSQLADAQLVANPGCYTSTSILGLAPLVCGGFVEPTGIIIDAKSGVSGAGRAAKVGTLFAECNESISAYGVGTHRHQPEIDQVLSTASGKKVEVLFTPHLTPMNRGILSTMYATPAKEATVDELLGAMREFYADEPFVKVVDHPPATKHVANTNYCHVTARIARGRVMVLSVTDNLLKGASGVAVQNFNLMAGFDETTGLL